jgi:SAM-dependent methyltransferase
MNTPALTPLYRPCTRREVTVRRLAGLQRRKSFDTLNYDPRPAGATRSGLAAASHLIWEGMPFVEARVIRSLRWAGDCSPDARLTRNPLRQARSRRLVRHPAQMDLDQIASYQASYDRVADEYVRRIFDELQHKPLDRELLDRFAARVRAQGPACDMGCGPGHVARYLQEQGVDVVGIDLSKAMIEHARRLTPKIEFRQGDMLSLDVPDESWAAIVAFYSIIHIPPGDLPRALGELRRALRPGGTLLVAFHIGDSPIHLDEWWGHKVSVDFFFFQSEEIAACLRAAGFDVDEVIERDPYPGVEHPSRRSYIFARRPSQ